MTLTASKSTLTASTSNLAASIIFLTASGITLTASEAKQNEHYLPSTCQDRSENEVSFLKYCKIENETNCLSLNFWRSKRKRSDCSKILEEQSESKGISPTFSESMVKRIGVFQKFVKTKQNEVKLFKILQDQSKMNCFVSNCVEEEKNENTKFRFFGGKKRRKTNIIVPQLSKICHC
jgi:hypothetical protein